MTVVFGLAVYFMMWWVILFAMLPFGLHRTQQEAGDIEPGSEPSAPEKPNFLKVILLTTFFTTLLFAGYVALRESGYTLDDFPYFKPPSTR